MSLKAKIEIDGKVLEYPVIEGSEKEKAIDIAKLRADTGCITIDHGFLNTGSCASAITFLDGELGILRYRGYPIEQLAEKSTFIEVAYLLNWGNLPTQAELASFEKKVASYSKLPEYITRMIELFPKTAHPMAIASSVTVALSAHYPELNNPNPTKEQKDEIFALLLGQFKIITAAIQRVTTGQPLVASNPALSYTEDFMSMMGMKASKDVAKALDVLLILHADHEQNCSTSTVRVVGSSNASVFASISAGIDALWGPLHGGANQEVLEMLEEISNAGGDYKKALERAKDKNDTFKLMGFGHRVYKNFDPRAKIIKKACDTVLAQLGVKDPYLDIAKGLEQTALADDYFKSRNLYPNVDFYSGIIYRALGIPTNMFTVMFALGRMPGWLAQWKEMRETKETKISRPRQVYTGATTREYTDLGKR
ncbi:citrate synthase [Bacteriovorax stolpii]|uniref:Citrate synthase n=1 Tax=Bacteriovorax stolpii TaxID=960 RepID=A0A2K9NV79_BACTC|nr:citrate synthase [Bacteriovorax stolpii]AUN98975.1 citrate (Si)-synthase [Bacteriovorax stolpii]QDK41029.1 citrate synthase [Bacteriovorax stolpii]TDP55502.1 citrate synthase [Bacteriovorax stolpii]